MEDDSILPAGRGRPARAARRLATLDYVEKVLTGGLAFRRRSAYGGRMELTSWAEIHARGLLSPMGRRWRHAEAVAVNARDLARSLTPEDADLLVAAAYLHDVGYAPKLAISGFHPLDGARHVRSLGRSRLAGLVAHHTGARHEARLRCLQQALAEFDDEGSLISAALAYCDLTTGPNGERMNPEQRLLDVEARYGEDSPVTVGLRTAFPEMLDAVKRVVDLQGRTVQTAATHPT